MGNLHIEATVKPEPKAPSPLSLDELARGLARVNLDRPDRAFFNHPHLLEWIKSNEKLWLESLYAKVLKGYIPSGCVTCYVPKGNWLVRPGSVLTIEDEVMYNALVGRTYPEIWERLKNFQKDPDVAYQLQDPSEKDWIKRGFLVWKDWRELSVQKMTDRVSYVVFADIAAFYDNIELSVLRSDLAALNVDGTTLSLLMDLLNRWAGPKRRGIPQGHSASDILAKLYMNSTDQAIKDNGLSHLRYVDDLRIFCDGQLEAKRAVNLIISLLGGRGLCLQSAKSEILSREKATSKIDGVIPAIEGIQVQLSKELSQGGPYDGFAGLKELDESIRKDENTHAPEVLERAFNDRFINSDDSAFDRTLFRYLLTRLAIVPSRVAVTYCLTMIRRRPEETDAVLRYLSAVTMDATELEELLKYCSSDDAIYDYQLYQIVEWFYARSNFPVSLVPLLRSWRADKNRAPWLRSISTLALGACGNTSDLENLEREYPEAATDIERADIVAALWKAEKGRRNAFYSRVQEDSCLIGLSVQCAKQK